MPNTIHGNVRKFDTKRPNDRRNGLERNLIGTTEKPGFDFVRMDLQKMFNPRRNRSRLRLIGVKVRRITNIGLPPA